MYLDPLSADRAVRLLIYVAGIASTLVGSWFASKIHVYQENKKQHQEELKQKILIPIRSALDDSYFSLVSHTSEVVSTPWARRSNLPDANVTEQPEVYGTILQVGDPRSRIEANLDEALLLDAGKTHYRELIAGWEEFRDGWTKHSHNCEAWVSKMAGLILEQSGLAAAQAPSGEPYVLHRELAAFVYRRMFQISTGALTLEDRGGQTWLMGRGGGIGFFATGNGKELLGLVEDLLKSELRQAQELRQEADGLRADLKSLHQKLSLAIAEKKLRRHCAIVPFM